MCINPGEVPKTKEGMIKEINKMLDLSSKFTWKMNTDKIRQIYYAVLELRAEVAGGGNQ